jgi:hypothetical protein
MTDQWFAGLIGRKEQLTAGRVVKMMIEMRDICRRDNRDGGYGLRAMHPVAVRRLLRSPPRPCARSRLGSFA